MALAQDGAGNVWVGTEGKGVWRFDAHARTNQWRQFTTTNGLGDDYAYTVALDKLGRVWVGHLNHGVSVFNGYAWTNYDVPYGPIGERIFKMAICPLDGDVWMGTSAGLTRYSVSKDTWSHFTRNEEKSHISPASGGEGNVSTLTRPAATLSHPMGEGLPADQITAIAFDKQGNIFVGTQCDGIAMASRESNYQDWKQAPMADQKVPTVAGYGLPSPLINDLLVATDGSVYAATDGGLAWSRDDGKTWIFRRGKDYPAKMKGLAGGPPKDWSGQYIPKDVPPEDYVTCLAEDNCGVIWADFRSHGMLALSGYTYEELDKMSVKETGGADYGRAILPTRDYRPWLASYGKGLLRATEPRQLRHLQVKFSADPEPATEVPFPSRAQPPNLEELNTLLKEIQSVPSASFTNGQVLALEDDWRTEGQWTGRYGRFWIVLCANWSPKDDVWGAGWDVQYDARMGLNHRPGDSLRYWVHWLATKDNRALEMSPTYLHSRVLKNLTTWDVDRRQSEWDDHGEAYSMNMDGPHVYCSLSIPAGLFYLSLYDDDKDGHTDNNRFRDYTFSIRPHPGRTSLDEHHGRTTIIRSFYDIAEFNQKPELAHARIHDFWGGAYKRFLVRGPTKLTIQANRNYSFNTILAGVMLDLVDELPPPYFQTRQEWEQTQAEKTKTVEKIEAFRAATDGSVADRKLAVALQDVQFKNPVWWAENKRRLYLPLLRWQQANEPTNHTLLASSYYQLNMFADWEKELKMGGHTTAREIERAIRWDGLTYSCAGMGNRMVQDYLREHSHVNDDSLGKKP